MNTDHWRPSQNNNQEGDSANSSVGSSPALQAGCAKTAGAGKHVDAGHGPGRAGPSVTKGDCIEHTFIVVLFSVNNPSLKPPHISCMCTFILFSG